MIRGLPCAGEPRFDSDVVQQEAFINNSRCRGQNWRNRREPIRTSSPPLSHPARFSCAQRFSAPSLAPAASLRWEGYAVAILGSRADFDGEERESRVDHVTGAARKQSATPMRQVIAIKTASAARLSESAIRRPMMLLTLRIVERDYVSATTPVPGLEIGIPSPGGFREMMPGQPSAGSNLNRLHQWSCPACPPRPFRNDEVIRKSFFLRPVETRKLDIIIPRIRWCARLCRKRDANFVVGSIAEFAVPNKEAEGVFGHRW